MPMQKTTPECRSILPIRPECGRDHLATVKKLINRGDFDGALRQSQETLERSSAPPRADAALMTMGLVAAHPANPKKDYKRALGYFKQLLHDYPASGLAEEGKIWVGVLESFEKAKQVDIDIEQKKKDLGK
ncbi:MAG TPA: tetratricopeptide repeat protein [Nitrospirota bacterium]|nr:tetratricopeptide repeat protein [Nitrospirota bacterium]